MSQLCKDSITCPKCHKEGEFEYWSSINVDLDPELKEKIFNEEIFVWTCPECGAKVFSESRTISEQTIMKLLTCSASLIKQA